MVWCVTCFSLGYSSLLYLFIPFSRLCAFICLIWSFYNRSLDCASFITYWEIVEKYCWCWNIGITDRWKSDKYENQMQFATQPYHYRMQALPSEAQRGIGKRIPAVQPSLGLIWNPSERRAVLCFHRWAVDPDRPWWMDREVPTPGQLFHQDTLSTGY